MEKGKFFRFGLTIHPKGGELVDWKTISKEEIEVELAKLGFINQLKLAQILLDTKIFKERKVNKTTEESKNYYAEIKDFGGQLELGDENRTPHYQMWIELKSKVRKSKVLNYYSELLYGEKISPAISVFVLTEDSDDFKQYCMKEKRADLPDKYRHINIDKTIGELDKYIKDNPEAKKSWKVLMDIRDIS